MSSRANWRALGSFNKAHIWLLTICLLAESSMVLPPYTAAAHKHPLKPHFCVPILSQRSQSFHLTLNTSSHQSNNCAEVFSSSQNSLSYPCNEQHCHPKHLQPFSRIWNPVALLLVLRSRRGCPYHQAAEMRAVWTGSVL